MFVSVESSSTNTQDAELYLKHKLQCTDLSAIPIEHVLLLLKQLGFVVRTATVVQETQHSYYYEWLFESFTDVSFEIGD